MWLTLLIFILILGVLIFVHEFGHFIVAKRSGIGVKEFAFGFRPRLWAIKRGETEYAINWLPIGGYVRLEGEEEDTGKKSSFLGASAKTRAKVLAAGVVMNLILAWILLTIVYAFGSYPLTQTFASHPGVISVEQVVIVDVSAGSPAASAKLKAGDIIEKINGQKITTTDQLVEVVKKAAGTKSTIDFSRNGHQLTATATPRVNAPADQGALGVAIGEVGSAKAVWYKAPGVAILEMGGEIKSTFVALWAFLQGLFIHHHVGTEVSGIIGVGEATGVVRRLGLMPLLQFVALISTNLAVVNLLPILPLDGGHLLFIGLEATRRRPVHENLRNWVALIGLAALILLFVVVTYNDIVNFQIIQQLKRLF